jgi:peptidyl-prolyl cis-trans isomerase A (cyclophilin A)
MQTRRALLILAALPVFSGLAVAEPSPAAVRVDIVTGQGRIVLELYPDKAPITVANFLKYVKTRRLDATTFYRAMRTQGAETTGLIQGGLQNDPARLLTPIAHESTTVTGLKHLDGTISMSRNGPGTATADFFICVGDAPYLDANPDGPAGADNLGYAAFGRVADGMEVVRAILALPTTGKARNPVMQGQIIDPPVPIITARVESGSA